MPRTTKHLKPHQFKKGEPSANPLGAKVHNPLTKALRKTTLKSYQKVIHLVFCGNLEELKKICDSTKRKAIEVAIARAFYRALQAGDFEVVERIAQRIIGKIPDKLQVESTNQNQNINYDANQLAAIHKKITSDV